ncbi:hypothetical protein HS088_TW22G00902 [Tripterygium wilfordii]|uniref:Organ-specific protein P4-like n=1 Tax=Tripterygium wilfordii TaxID=458696 RepID=A0A7J7BZB1_TRIWF|nr:organ-specific protein P4-like [Tripterygium wilfordii]KAF5727214.1 hypothetical protein HS088_TW22G00902 [Tripterygium wilfordii]
MKPICVFFLLFSLLRGATLSNGRKEPGYYWKSIMKDQPMPEAIKNLFQLNPTPLSEEEGKFVKDFDFGANAIIYHSRDHHKAEKFQSSHQGLAVADTREGGDGYQIARQNIK